MLSHESRQSYLLWLRERGQAYPLLRVVTQDTTAPAEENEAALPTVAAAPVRLVAFSATPLTVAERELLDKMIAAMGLRSEQVAVSSQAPPAASPRPELVLALGTEAAEALGQRADSRGLISPYPLASVGLLLTAHPSLLLQQPAAKRQAWSDLQVGMRALGLLL